MLILVQVQHLSHRGSRFLFCFLVGVDIDIQRGRYIGVTEKFLNLLDVHSLRQKQTACCMTQVVKTNFRQVVPSCKNAFLYMTRLYHALVERYDRLKAQYDEVSTAISDNEARYEQMGRFITVLKDQEGVIAEFDDALWSSPVEKMVVKSKEDVTVVFKDGSKMKAE